MKLRPDPGTDSVTATRLAATTPPHAEPVDVTRIARSTAADSDATRIARDVSDIASEGTRIRGRVLPTQPDSNTGCESVERYRIGDKIGDRYEVIAIHHGTMGVVYGTYDHREKLPRALKTLQKCHADDKVMRELFEEEAATWIRLEKHPYIVRAYHVTRFETQPHVITEYIIGEGGKGSDLRSWIGHPSLTLPVAVEMALQIAQGMQHAVRTIPTLVHRDLKPANILVSGDAKALVTDFGLVQSAQVGAGTPAYMSPEQWGAASLDLRSDIYAYGCVLFEMLTAHRMFPATTEAEWEHAHREIVPPSLKSVDPALPDEIDFFVRSCLEKSPEKRPQDWDEVVAFIGQWYHRLTGQPVVYDFSSIALSADEWIDASYSLLYLGKKNDVLNACEKALALDPLNIHALRNKGVALDSFRRYDEALDAFEKALAVNPNFVAALKSKHLTLRSLERYDEAIHALEQVLAINPDDVYTWKLKGEDLSYGRVRRYEEAVDAFRHVLSINPSDEHAWFCLGSSLCSLDRHADAIDAYDRALQIDSGNRTTWNFKGNALQKLERYEDAVYAYDQAIKNQDPLDIFGKKDIFRKSINKSCAAIFRHKGDAFLALERYEDALGSYDMSLALDPDAFTWIAKTNALHGL